MPAMGTSSNQYFLLTHLYEFFGTLLGCSQQGMTGFDKYDGQPSMYKVHKFMNLGEAELTYFISQVGAAAASFGVAKDDITAVANALSSTFGMKCAAPAEVIKGSGPQAQAICIGDGCPEAKEPQCSAYAAAVAPAKCSAASMSGSMMPSGTSMPSGSGSMTGSMPASMTGTMTKPATTNPTGAAGVNGVNIAAAAAAIAALAL
ncbi:hypothetical protein VHEMI02220 [[Torrubiella] hemipterigena]|uniref:Globin n=1 Tax=[Torrubiella] hemipterigena TaxID=1531966 RepID=A0A0A1T7N5_9HYPO|nr:hypothetical protein VHEMI02220 [[Torrubiella] hemipterigena]